MAKLTHAERRKNAPPCTVAECDRPIEYLRMGLCEMHALRMRKYGTLDKPTHWKTGTAAPAKCQVADCIEDRRNRAKYCSKHYHRILRYGDPTFDPIAAARRQCAQIGCDALTTADHGLCKKHARRFYAVRQKGTIEQKARNDVANALQSGRLTKGPCETCGATHKVHGHHDDYLKPLVVRWLCPKHHAEHHIKRKP